MAKSKETFSKKEKEKLKAKKKKEKLIRSEERKSNATGGGLDSMMAYVDEFGNLSNTPPAPPVEKKTSTNQSNQNRVKTNQNFRNHE